jgi:hypothetical protein
VELKEGEAYAERIAHNGKSIMCYIQCDKKLKEYMCFDKIIQPK